MEDLRKREFEDRIVIGPMTKTGITQLTRYCYSGASFFKNKLTWDFGIDWNLIANYDIKFLLSGEPYLITLIKK